MNKPLHKEAEWLFKYWTNQLTESEKKELEEWVSQSPDRQQLLEQFSNEAYLQNTIESLQEADKKAIWDRMTRQEPSLRPGPLQRIWPRLAVAAAVLIIVSTYLLLQQSERSPKPVLINLTRNKDIAPGTSRATLTLANGQSIVLDSAASGPLAQQGHTQVLNKDGQLLYTPTPANNKEILYNTLTTARGQTYPVTLSDHSRVWLNAESSIRFPVTFTGHERKVEITGEVYFEVAHNAALPFIVTARGVAIQVLGTTFNVNAYNDETALKTTLLEGSVRLKKGQQQKQLKPGQQAQVKANDITINDHVDIEKAIAWKKGLFTFKGDQLSEVMKSIARWYNIDVEFEGNASAVEISGDIYRTANLSEVLKILSALDVASKIEGHTLILKAR